MCRLSRRGVHLAWNHDAPRCCGVVVITGMTVTVMVSSCNYHHTTSALVIVIPSMMNTRATESTHSLIPRSPSYHRGHLERTIDGLSKLLLVGVGDDCVGMTVG